jgi:hypothetical protein
VARAFFQKWLLQVCGPVPAIWQSMYWKFKSLFKEKPITSFPQKTTRLMLTPVKDNRKHGRGAGSALPDQRLRGKVVYYPRCCVLRQSITKDVLICTRRLEVTHVLRPNRFSNASPLGGNLVRATPFD